MEKPKIVHVIYAGLGGHANVLFPLLDSTFGEKFENIVVFFGVEATLPAYIAACKAKKIKYHSIQKKPRRYLGAFKVFRKILNEEKPHSVIVHSSELLIPAVAYKKGQQNSTVFYVEHQHNDSKGFTLNQLSKYALKKANGVICLNEIYKKELLSRYTCKAPIIVIPNGIDTKKYAPISTDTNGKLIIGMASRMIPGKDHTTLLHAFKNIIKKYPAVELHLAGNGETLAEVKELTAQLNLSKHVTFLGLLNEEEMLQFYASISIYVLATNHETLSTAILQAMACGLPTITSNIPNNKAIIDHLVDGLLYKDQNSVDLSQQIEYVIDNLGSLKTMLDASRQTIIKNYTVEKMAERYTNLIESDK